MRDADIVNGAGKAGRLKCLLINLYILIWPTRLIHILFTFPLSSAVYCMARPRTPPFKAPIPDEEHPYSWYWEDDAGDHILTFGQYKDQYTKIHDASLSYLLYCNSVCHKRVSIRLSQGSFRFTDHYSDGCSHSQPSFKHSRNSMKV